MFAKLFALFALVAVALAAPKPAPAPQVYTYSTGLDYVYPGAVPYAAAAPVSPYAAAPLTYPTLPGGAVYLR